MRYGYGRVSTTGQSRDGNSLEDQREKLLAAGCDELVLEAYTGKTMERPKFTQLKERMTSGDTLVVCKLDRFARTAREGLEVVDDLMDRGISVHILNMGLIENTPVGRLILTNLLAFAEFERDTILERTQAGKAIARQKSDYRDGRPKKEVTPEVADYMRRQKAGEVSVRQACRELKMSPTTWYKLKGVA